MDLGVMMMKRYSTHSKYPEQEPFSHILDNLIIYDIIIDLYLIYGHLMIRV